MSTRDLREVDRIVVICPVVVAGCQPVLSTLMTTAGATSSPYVSEAPRLGFVGGFDGVRGIGILMVLFNHAYSNLSPSFAGIIDVFFVMSAFLITTLLLQEHRDTSTINMRKFYSRRAVRLLPSVYLCIVAWFVVTILFARERLTTLVAESAAAVTYLYEIFFPVGLGALDPRLVPGGAAPPYRYVFADPPYKDVPSEVPALLRFFFTHQATLLGPHGVLVVEHDRRTDLNGELARVDVRRYGDTALSFFAAPGTAPTSHATQPGDQT